MKKVVLFLMVALSITGCSVKKIEEQKDSEKFAIEYNISEKNPFHYTSIDEVLSLFTEGTGIVFLGNPDGEWSRLCVKILNQALSKTKIDSVAYLNLKIAKEKNPKKYKKLINIISPQLEKKEKLQTPALFFIKDGKIMNYTLDYEEITKKNEEGYTEEEQKKLKQKYVKLIEEYQQKDA